MKISGKSVRLLLALAAGPVLGFSLATAAAAETVTVNVAQPGAKINPLLYGLMTEEINYSYDGGLYGELIRNRIFRDPPVVAGGRGNGRGRGAATATGPASTAAAPAAAAAAPNPIPHWTLVKSGSAAPAISLDAADPINTTALTTSLKLEIPALAAGERAGVANDGYWGFPIRPNTKYRLSFYAKASADFAGPVTASLETDDGAVQVSGQIAKLSAKWQKYDLTLTTRADAKPSVAGKFVLSTTSKGTLWFNLVSLFPPTFNDRPNGNRVDLMKLLEDMHPAFLRFPGGNYVEGNTFDDHFDWRRTLGPLEDRPGHQGTWQYRSADGMGLLEYLNWCEDLKMEPVLAVFAGHILGNNPGGAVTGDALKPYIEEALDEIEYVTGDASTKWGAVRAKNGHPAPFKLTYVEIGNEDNLSMGLATYESRFTDFATAIKAKYPQLQLISTVPSNQRNYERTSKPDVIDDHYYFGNGQAAGATAAVQRAMTEAHHYDAYDRKGPKIFVGEWATRIGNPTSTFQAAIGDAAFLTGLERNADIVVMSCYAPLLVNVNPAYPQYAGGPTYPSGMQWPTDLIGYDTMSSFGSAGYYVQWMFYNNKGDTVLPISLGETAPADIFASSNRDSATGDVILKLVSNRATAAAVDITLQGVTSVDKNATGWVLTAAADDVNTIAEPKKVAPKAITLDNAAAKFTYTLPATSVVVLRIKAK